MNVTLIIENNNSKEDNKINEKEIEKYSKLNKQDPYTSANTINRLFVYWVYDIIKLSHYVSLKPEFLGNLHEELKSKNYINDLKYLWFDKQYKNKKFHPLLRAAFLANKLLLFYVMINVFIKSVMNAVRLTLYRELMSRFTSENNYSYYIYSFFSLNEIAILYIVIRIIHVFLWRKSLEYQCLLAYKVSSQFQCLIFEKLLRISPSSMKERIDTGQVINYIQSDSEKLINLMWNSPELFCMPFQMVIYLYMLYSILGYVFLFGALVLILFISSNLYFQKKMKSLIKVNMKLKDKRMKITTETFNNIKILKLYSWEEEFKNKINFAREEELSNLLEKFKVLCLNNSIQWAAPVITSLISIGLFQYIRGEFKIEDVFTAIGIFNNLQKPLRLFPLVLSYWYETAISMGRIENYLRQDEIEEKNVILNDSECIEKDIRVKIENGDYSWGIPPINLKEEIERKKKKRKKKKKKEKEIIKENINNEVSMNKEKEIELTTVSTDIDPNKESNVSNVNNNNMTSDSIYLNNIQEEENDPSLSDLNLLEHLIINDNYKPNININPLIPILRNLNFEIKNGEFICIIGEVGSGKSSLLQCILNNLLPLNPKAKIYINGNISYVSQIPWICNATVKNNILFYNSFNEEKYNKIIDLSCLRADLEIFEGGDLTEIGEKGVNLSGGQKARIAIARALYSDKDIYIFDDPISALDAHVGMKVMKDCILGYLHNKTRILATHALQYISFADRIIYLNKGEIKWIGSYNEIKKQHFFIEFYEKMKEDEKKKKQKEDEEKENDNDDENNDKDPLNTGIVKRITQDEKMYKERIKLSLLNSFILNMGGYHIPIIMTLFQISMIGFKSASNVFLSIWSNYQSKEKNNEYFLIYSLLCIGSCLFNYCLLSLCTRASIIESRKIHDLMINSLIGAPVSSFHETVPKGQIFNRLSKDIENIDNNAINQMRLLLYCILDFVCSIAICAFFEPYVLILVPILLIFGFFWTKFNLKCLRELYRIEGIVRSPILNLTNEAIPGSIVIRAFKCEKNYLERFFQSIDDYLNVRIVLNGNVNFYDLVLDFLSIFLAAFLIFFCIIFKETFSASQIGLILTYYEIIDISIFNGLHTFQNFQNTMVDFERCEKFTLCPKESPKVKVKDYIDSLEFWPSHGKIQFENLSVKYREDTDLVLKNLNLTINPKEKVGIVGRTGSGKSTITLCLFRLLEANTGKILIDDIDISKIGLKKLRENLTIIPQDPSLMEGSLKFNIDPLDLNSYEDILEVMKLIGFDYIIDRDPKGLSQEISESGSNLSVGEKQLICITRAILRKSKIIIMDEATASIDYKTEEIIQKAIHELLNDSTVITIAHRIKTILNYDKIVTLDHGEIIDFDSPKNLLEKKEGIFYELYQKSTT